MFFSEGVRNLILYMCTKGRPKGRLFFPPNIKSSGEEKYRKSDKTPSAWFRRVVDSLFDGDPEICSIDDNIAIFIDLEWENEKEIVFISIQAFIANTGCLTSAYLDDSTECEYFRLDVDTRRPGSLINHPMPHIHVKGSGGARFSLPVSGSNNVIFDFIDFIYRNYKTSEWESWLSNTYRSIHPENENCEDAFEFVLDSLFGRANSAILQDENYRETIKKISLAMQHLRSDIFPLSVADRFTNIYDHL